MDNPFDLIYRRLGDIEQLLLDIKQQPAAPAVATDQILTVGPAAKLLGLTTATIYGLVHERKIPFSKRGKRLYFSEQELKDWVREGRQKTAQEYTEDARQVMASLTKTAKQKGR